MTQTGGYMNIKRFFLFLFVSIALMSLSACGDKPNDSAPAVPNEYDLGDGYKLYDLIPSFVAYAEAAANKSDSIKNLLWDSLLEKKYFDFFNQVIYRNLQGTDRDNYKSTIIKYFWSTIVPQRINTLRMLDEVAVKKILASRLTFKQKFPGFKPDCDYYQTVSFSFNGKAVDLNGKTVLAIGLENFISGDIQLDFTIAHEQFHLYHFGKGFSPSGGLYRGIWSEGMATRAQLEIYPGNYSYSQMLNFPQSKVQEIISKWDTLIKDVQINLFTTDQTIKRAYLGSEYNTLGIPPACGYQIGLRLVMKLMQDGNSFSDMTSWTAEQVQVKMQEVLPNLKSN